ncbi:MAG: ABC transporter permease [Saprospiraceae bacterium]
MLSNYLKVAWRTLRNNKIYSLINIGGLAIGLAVSMLILLFVIHEFNYDRFHQGADQIHRLHGQFKFGEQTFNTSAMSAGVASIAVQQIPELVSAVRINSNYSPILQSDRNHIVRIEEFLFADANFLELFSFDLLSGDARTALEAPNSILLTPDLADQFFGTQDVIGRDLQLEGDIPVKVTGLIAKAPSNSTFSFQSIASIETLRAVEQKENLGAEPSYTLDNDKVQLGSFNTYFQVMPKADVEEIADKLAEIAQAPEDSEVAFTLNPLASLHLDSPIRGQDDIKYLYLFLAIALLILSLALVNYISLATARAVKRAKEVSIRKINGAKRYHLLRQFYSESILVSLIAFALGFGILQFLMPTFLNIVDIQIDQSFYLDPILLITFGGLLVFSSLAAGSIPAILMSSFEPIQVLQGQIQSGKRGHLFRKGLTVFQFTATLALLITSIFTIRQLTFLQEKTLTLAQDEIVTLPVSETAQKGFQAYKKAILETTAATELTVSSDHLFAKGSSIYFVESPINQKSIPLSIFNVDRQFIDFFGLDWKVPPLDQQKLGAPSTIIFNETAQVSFGFQKDSVGKSFEFLGGSKEIVGVLEDFHYKSLRSKINPVALFVQPEDKAELIQSGGLFYIRFPKGTAMKSQIQKLTSLHKEFEPGQPFAFDFLDETLAAFYETERRLTTLLSAFTGVAIFISCLGLLGLVTYNTERRTKEIGIRKVLGASVHTIVGLLTREFVFLILISLLIASPISWYFVDQWLDNFVYQIQLKWWVFILAGLSAILLAFISVGWQATRAAIANPVESLRNE